MTPPLPPSTTDKQRQGAIRTQLEGMANRLEANERRIVRLQNTVQGIARETGDITVTYPCLECDRCLLLIRDGVLYCPHCHYNQTL